jgi:hypothetical protein
MSHSEHSKHHGALYPWAMRFNCCQQCGTTAKKHAGHGLCTTCYQR